jgi:hypothetical protein
MIIFLFSLELEFLFWQDIGYDNIFRASSITLQDLHQNEFTFRILDPEQQTGFHSHDDFFLIELFVQILDYKNRVTSRDIKRRSFKGAIAYEEPYAKITINFADIFRRDIQDNYIPIQEIHDLEHLLPHLKNVSFDKKNSLDIF